MFGSYHEILLLLKRYGLKLTQIDHLAFHISLDPHADPETLKLLCEFADFNSSPSMELFNKALLSNTQTPVGSIKYLWNSYAEAQRAEKQYPWRMFTKYFTSFGQHVKLYEEDLKSLSDEVITRVSSGQNLLIRDTSWLDAPLPPDFIEYLWKHERRYFAWFLQMSGMIKYLQEMSTDIIREVAQEMECRAVLLFLPNCPQDIKKVAIHEAHSGFLQTNFEELSALTEREKASLRAGARLL